MTAEAAFAAMLVALTYDLKQDYLGLGYSAEEVAELDRAETIDSLVQALGEAGHDVVKVGGAQKLVERLARGERWDLVFNLAEGLRGRARESQVPGVLDAFGIEHVFSDALTLSTCLDKRLAKLVVRAQGIPTPDFAVVSSPEQLGEVDLPFPLFAKPLAEGSSRGITGRSILRSEAELRTVCESLLESYRQPVLVERYLAGREFTVGILGTGDKARALGALEVVLTPAAEPGVYSYDNKEYWVDRVRYEVATDAEAVRAIEVALRAYRALGCRDAARLDVRSDEQGRPNFIEANPLAGLHEHSDLVILARMRGLPFRDLVGAILESAGERLAERAKRP